MTGGTAVRETTADLPAGPGIPPEAQALAWFSRPFALLEDCAHYFGDRFTLDVPGWGSPVVVVHDPDAVRDVFTAPDDVLAAGLANDYMTPLLGPQSLFVLDGRAHADERRLVLRLIGGAAVAGHGRLIQDIARRACATWPEGRPFRLLPALLDISAEVIIAVLFGAGRHLAEMHAQVRRVLADVGMGLAAAGGPAGNPAAARVREGLDRLDQLLRRECAAHHGNGNGASAGIAQVLLGEYAADDGGRPPQRLRDLLVTLLLAGHETTGTALAWTLLLLEAHPDVAGRVRAEIAALGPDPHPAEVTKLPLLAAVVNESLRMRPVVPVVVRQVLRRARVAGLDLQAGVRVSPCMHLAQRRSPPFGQPHRFDPGRFMLPSRISPYCYFPFGGGRRRCTGMGLALYEMKLVLAEVLSRFDLACPSAVAGVPVRRTAIIAPSQGAPLVLTRRRRDR